MEKYTLVNPKTGKHYDTIDERFYDDNWEKTIDTKEYLERLLLYDEDNKFEGYEITKID